MTLIKQICADQLNLRYLRAINLTSFFPDLCYLNYNLHSHFHIQNCNPFKLLMETVFTGKNIWCR